MEQRRFILAMVLSGAVLLIWQTFFAPKPRGEQSSGERTVAEQQADQSGDAGAAADTDHQPSKGASAAKSGASTGDQTPESAVAGQQPTGESDQTDTNRQAQPKSVPTRPDVEVRRDVLQTDRFRVQVTNDQARVTSVKLKEPEQYQAKDDLVGFPDDAKHYPFTTSFIDKSFDFPDAPVYEVAETPSVRTADGTYQKIVYRYDDPRGRYRVDKIYSVDPELPYTIDMDLEITNDLDQGRIADTVAVDMFDWKDPTAERSFLNFRPNEIEGVCLNSEDLERESFESITESSELFDAGQTLWGAVDTRYFMMAAIPDARAVRCELDNVDKDYIRTRLVHDGFSIPAGQTKTISHTLYTGPKDVDILDKIDDSMQDTVRLGEAVDYGIFSFIARPMRWGLKEIYSLVGNWGLAIILLTFLIRGLLWPINMKAYSSMERMKQVQPLLNKIKEKYDDDRERQTEETMKIFKKYDVSPAGGCLPMIMQMPILYGLYVMIYNSVEIYHADFMLWYTNLAEPDPFYVLPAIMGVVMFAQQQMSSKGAGNKQAAMMMKIMPVMFTAFMIFLPSGLVLYYALSLLIGVGQQYWIRKRSGHDDIDIPETV